MMLALAACTTRVLETTRQPVSAAGAHAMTGHGFVDGELVLRFTAEGERAVAPVVGKPPGRLRLGIPSLDRLNSKYKATELVTVPGERGLYLLRLSPDANVMRAAEEYGRDPLVSSAQPNHLFRIPRPAEAPEAVRTDVAPEPRTGGQ